MWHAIGNGGESEAMNMKAKTTGTQDDRGYQHCACRDCFDLAIGAVGAFCWACKEAGCPDYSECHPANQECQRQDFDDVSSEDPEGHHWDEARSEFVRDDHRDPEVR